MRIVLYKNTLDGSEKLYTNDNSSSISNKKARPKSICVACVKETIMSKFRPAKPKVMCESCGNKYTSGRGIANSITRSLKFYLVVCTCTRNIFLHSLFISYLFLIQKNKKIKNKNKIK